MLTANMCSIKGSEEGHVSATSISARALMLISCARREAKGTITRFPNDGFGPERGDSAVSGTSKLAIEP
jgi:hypothetical protein